MLLTRMEISTNVMLRRCGLHRYVRNSRIFSSAEAVPEDLRSEDQTDHCDLRPRLNYYRPSTVRRWSVTMTSQHTSPFPSPRPAQLVRGSYLGRGVRGSIPVGDRIRCSLCTYVFITCSIKRSNPKQTVKPYGEEKVLP